MEKLMDAPDFKPSVTLDVASSVLEDFSVGDEVTVRLRGTIASLSVDTFNNKKQGSMRIELSERVEADDFSDLVEEEDD